MMRRHSIGLLAAAALFLIATPLSPGASGFVRCGHQQIGGLYPTVTASHVPCSDARGLVRAWWSRGRTRRCSPTPANHDCRVTHVHGFRCVEAPRGAEQFTLRCKRARKRVHAYGG
jgi:hypothetical protein